MTKQVICTGWNEKGWEVYGATWVRTFNAFAPAGVELVTYCEGLSRQLGRVEWRPLLDIPGAEAFLKRHELNAHANGRKEHSMWKPGEVAAGYSYRWDAVKFSRMAVIPAAAALAMGNAGILAWFDGDVRATAAFPANWLDDLLGDADVVYLGREPKHSEIGFTAYRLPSAFPFLEDFAKHYTSDAVFGLEQTHSAFVWDHCRRGHMDLKFRNLTPGGRGHVWPGSPLGRFTQHLKGARKLPGGQKTGTV